MTTHWCKITFSIPCCETENKTKLRNEVYRIQRMIKLMLDTTDDSTVVSYGKIDSTMDVME